jgi:hypothetical protein
VTYLFLRGPAAAAAAAAATIAICAASFPSCGRHLCPCVLWDVLVLTMTSEGLFCLIFSVRRRRRGRWCCSSKPTSHHFFILSKCFSRDERKHFFPSLFVFRALFLSFLSCSSPRPPRKIYALNLYTIHTPYSPIIYRSINENPHPPHSPTS